MKKYEWAGTQEAGDCSLWIRAATLEFDDGEWECQVTASDFTTQDALTSSPVRLVVRGKCCFISSEEVLLKYGIPQGSLLGPILFTVYDYKCTVKVYIDCLGTCRMVHFSMLMTSQYTVLRFFSTFRSSSITKS